MWWLSFADPDKPKGTQFLGCVITDVSDYKEAIQDCWDRGINPGGEVLGQQFPRWVWLQIPAPYRHRLLTKNEAEALDDLLDRLNKQ